MVVVPYSTCVLEDWLVVHVMVAEVDVMFVAVTAENTKGAVPDVVKLKFGEVDVTPDELVDTTWKLYVVPVVRPVSDTAW